MIARLPLLRTSGRALSRLLVLGCLIATGASVASNNPSSAYFCQGDPGPQTYSAAAAIRLIPDGDVQFEISKWQENGHHFGLGGVAQKDGDRWIYKERTRQSIYNEDDDLFYEVDTKPNAKPTCKVTIVWPRNDDLAIFVDEEIGCQDHHGRAFGWFSSRFTADDYNGAVRGELDEADKANFGRRCEEPEARRGPVQVLRNKAGFFI